MIWFPLRLVLNLNPMLRYTDECWFIDRFVSLTKEVMHNNLRLKSNIVTFIRTIFYSLLNNSFFSRRPFYIFSYMLRNITGIVSFPRNFFISREAATAERRYKKERWSENYVHMAAFCTRTPPSLPPPPLFSLPPSNAITRAASLRSHFCPPPHSPKRIMDRSWQPRPKSRMASI